MRLLPLLTSSLSILKLLSLISTNQISKYHPIFIKNSSFHPILPFAFCLLLLQPENKSPLPFITVIDRTFSLCRVREIVFEKKRETLLLRDSYCIAKGGTLLIFKLIRHRQSVLRVCCNRDESGSFHFNRYVTA